MAKTNTQAASEVKTAAAVYTKERLAASQKYANRRDIISALLEAGKTYTLAEVDALIEKFMKGKVK